jgi:SAM-dependent methyltransferase
MDPKRIVKSAYDKIGSDYQATRRIDSQDILNLHLLTDRLTKGTSVLDAGCGSGFPVSQILAENFQVTGVDFSTKQTHRAKAGLSKSTFVCADLANLPFHDSTFDAIVSFYALIHIPREEHQQLIMNFHRILKPKGLAFLCMGAGDLPPETAEYLGAKMFWSHYDRKTNLEILERSHFAVFWSDIVVDPIDSKAAHLFVLAEKMNLQ